MELPKLPIANTIRDQVYQLLKNEICQGVYEPGYWLQEKELSQRLRVSRSPVREALLQLGRDGLVRNIPNKGVFVREFSIRDIEDVFDLRIMMESFAILHTRPELGSQEKETLLELLLGDLELQITDRIPARFFCNCSKERVTKAIVSIGEQEIREMIQEGKPIEVNCHFCNTNYTFTPEELKEIIT